MESCYADAGQRICEVPGGGQMDVNRFFIQGKIAEQFFIQGKIVSRFPCMKIWSWEGDLEIAGQWPVAGSLSAPDFSGCLLSLLDKS